MDATSRHAAAVTLLLVFLLAPHTAFADDDAPYLDAVLGASGGMTLFTDDAVAGSVGPFGGVAVGQYHWALRPQIAAGALFHLGSAPHAFDLHGEAGAAIAFLGGTEVGLGATAEVADDGLEWTTAFLGLRKSMVSVPLVSGRSSGGKAPAQLELGVNYRLTLASADSKDTPTMFGGLFLGISPH